MSHISLHGLKRQARRYGITQDEIAAAANVGRTLVSHVFAGRAKSSNVVTVAWRLVAARRAVEPQPAGPLRPAAARRRSTARAALKHATGWAGDDLEARLIEVAGARSRAHV